MGAHLELGEDKKHRKRDLYATEQARKVRKKKRSENRINLHDT